MTDLPYEGRILWHELMTTDVERSKEFCETLFGWTSTSRETDAGFTYTILSNGNTQFGGVYPVDPGAGIPSNWITYFTTTDVDAFCAQASEMGAVVEMAPNDVPGTGRFAVLADAQGAHFSVITEVERTPAELPQAGAEPGSPVWVELMTSDPAAASAFYARMFGWGTKVMDIGTGPYTLLDYAGVSVAGIGQKPDDMPVAAWVIYFEVADLPSMLDKVTALGGAMLVPPVQVPTVGTFSWVTDPTGAVFALMQSEAADNQ